MIVRIDDYPHGDYILAQTRPLEYWREHFTRMVGAFEERGCPYVLAVSPGLCNVDECKQLSEFRNGVFAVHGWNHGWAEYGPTWSSIMDTWPAGGEFAGQPRERIREQLTEARRRLGTTLYVAPFNVVNQPTLDALADCGYTCVMAGQEAVRYGQDKLDYHGMTLDLCVPPYYGPAASVVNHLPTTRTIGLHWIYEDESALPAWQRLAEACCAR